MPPALDLDEPGPESEPLESGDPGMERHCETSRADMHMAVDSDSQLANLEQGEPEQELDSQMTDAPSSPEPAHSPINPSEWSSLLVGPHSSVDPADYSSESDRSNPMETLLGLSAAPWHIPLVIQHQPSWAAQLCCIPCVGPGLWESTD
jgi:hypothetical protein